MFLFKLEFFNNLIGNIGTAVDHSSGAHLVWDRTQIHFLPFAPYSVFSLVASKILADTSSHAGDCH